MRARKGFSKIVMIIMVVFIIASGVYIYSNISNKKSPDEIKLIDSLAQTSLFASDCLTTGGIVSQPTPDSSICAISGVNQSPVWPTLPTGWKYSDSNISNSDKLKIKIVSGNKEINCDTKGCR